MFFLFCFASSPLVEAPFVVSGAEQYAGSTQKQPSIIRPDFNHPVIIWSMDYLSNQQDQKSGKFVIYPCKDSSIYFACLEEEIKSWMIYFLHQDVTSMDMAFFSGLSYGTLHALQERDRTVCGLFRQEDVFPDSSKNYEAANLSAEESFQMRMANLDCNAMLVANLIKICTSQHGESQTFADILGVSSVQLSQLKQPLKYKLSDNSPTVVKVWQWFMNTEISDVLRITKVSEKELQEALEY